LIKNSKDLRKQYKIPGFQVETTEGGSLHLVRRSPNTENQWKSQIKREGYEKAIY